MEFLCVSLCFLLLLLFQNVSSQTNAKVPPRGWNSYTGFSWIISEDEFLQNAAVLSSRLLPAGYEYAVVDAFWFRSYKDGSHAIDEWGRPWPNPTRWPSSVNGVGFKVVADQVHRLGLKFGIQILGGISQRAVDEKTRIFDSSTGAAYDLGGEDWHADRIHAGPCKYAPTFLMVNTSVEAGKVFLKSLIDLYVSWGVDFVKLDCVFGENLNFDTIATVSEVLKENDQRSVVLSVSPGVGVTEVMARQVSGLVNMYRVTGNNWDQWDIVKQRFDEASKFASLIGIGGLKGNSWPDLDMLPFGRLTDPDSNQSPHRDSNLSPIEQRTQLTLFAMAKSPLMVGGDLRSIDQQLVDILTSGPLQKISYESSNNVQYRSPDPEVYTAPVWLATGTTDDQVFVAIFNLRDDERPINLDIPFLGTIYPGKTFTTCTGNDLWHPEFGVTDNKLQPVLAPHDCSLFVLSCP